jgi:hypothetical protein
MNGGGEQLIEPDVANGGAHQTARSLTDCTTTKDGIIKHRYKPGDK